METMKITVARVFRQLNVNIRLGLSSPFTVIGNFIFSAYLVLSLPKNIALECYCHPKLSSTGQEKILDACRASQPLYARTWET